MLQEDMEHGVCRLEIGKRSWRVRHVGLAEAERD